MEKNSLIQALKLQQEALRKDFELNNFVEALYALSYDVYKKLFEMSYQQKIKVLGEELENVVKLAALAPAEYTRCGYRDDLGENIKSLKEVFEAMSLTQQTASLMEVFNTINAKCLSMALAETVEPWLVNSEPFFAGDFRGQRKQREISLLLKNR